MRPILLCVFLGVVPCMAAPKDGPSAKDTLRQWAQAIQDDDMVKAASFYEASDDVIAIELRGTVRKGQDAIREMYAEAKEEVTFEEVLLQDLTVRQSGNVAWALCRFKARTALKTDQSEHKLEIRGSFVLKRTDGAWKIAREHFSPIAGVPRVEEWKEPEEEGEDAKRK